MAHELSFTNGQADTFSVVETPWHREGKILLSAPGYEEALTMANLDYDVQKRPTFISQPDGSLAQSTTGMVTVRTDTNQELGTVGPDYQVVTNAEAFEVLKPLIDSGHALLETGGVLRNGADAWLMIRWNLAKFGPVVREVFGEETLPFGLISTNHSGRRGLLLQDTPVRVVCANTLGMTEALGGCLIQHRSGAAARLVEEAEKLWGALIERYETVAAQYRNLKQTRLDLDQFMSLVVETVSPDPRLRKDFNPEARAADMVIERFERKRDALITAWEHGKGHVGDFSGWEAYNGAVEVIDHNRDLFPVRAGVYRTQALMFGVLKERKTAVLSKLVEFAHGLESGILPPLVG